MQNNHNEHYSKGECWCGCSKTQRGHWVQRILADKQANGKLICPIHRKPLRLSSNEKKFKRKIVLP